MRGVLAGERSVLPARLTALLDYTAKLTLGPAAVTRADLEQLRGAGLSDEALLHTVEIIAYFAFVNRLADGLGVQLEEP